MGFKVGDICTLNIAGMPHLGSFKVTIRGVGYTGYEWTVEHLGGPNEAAFHPCVDGPMRFQGKVGRWVNSRELTLVSPSYREPKGFAKFIRHIEKKEG